MIFVMGRRSKFSPPPVDLGEETLGQRLARLRKERGLTQIQLADKLGTIQAVVSSYEKDKAAPQPEMIARLSLALNITTDEILGLTNSGTPSYRPSLRLLKRVTQIAELSEAKQKVILQTIDAFLKGSSI